MAYEPGDLFLLCSDGLVEGLYDEQLVEFLRATPAGRTPADRLVEESLALSGRDNTTALVVGVL